MVKGLNFKWEKVKHPKYKYRVLEDITVPILPHVYEYENKYMKLTNNTITIKKDYMWDGASGGARDTEDFMLGSCIHDSMYQAYKEADWCKLTKSTFRGYADRVLMDVIKRNGMNSIKAWFVYRAVRIAGGLWTKMKVV